MAVGPDYHRLSAYSARPIQRLKLRRQSNVDYNAASQAGDLTKVQGDNIVVAAPMTVQKSSQLVAPKQVKAKLAKADLETGWTRVSDSKAKAQLQQKMKAEDPKAVPPPDMKPRDGSALDASASPTRGSSAAPSSDAPEERHGKGKNIREPIDQDRRAGATSPETAAPERAAPSVTSDEQQKAEEKTNDGSWITGSSLG